jgi:hypothetical protein
MAFTAIGFFGMLVIVWIAEEPPMSADIALSTTTDRLQKPV